MMDALAARLNSHSKSKSSSWQLHNKRLLLPVSLLILLLLPDTRILTINVLSDAFWQVAAYVAATLTLYHIISNRVSQQSQLSALLQRNSKYQVGFSALMGALPGCGGAIVVITQYVSGRLSFGSVVAVLTATMGDAAFLLLAAEPTTGLFILTVGSAIGFVSGLIIDAIHGPDFMRPTLAEKTKSTETDLPKPTLKLQGIFWQWLLVPASIIAVLGSFQINIDDLLFLPVGTLNIIGTALVLITMLLWATSREITNYESAVSEDPKDHSNLFQRVAQDTNFVTSWVIGAFLLFELTMHWTGINLESLFQNWALLLPLMGVTIGLLPGCGPQILVTSMYLSGALPLSAQLGNAISNDGDALFPAIALAPKAALLATLYSSIPAVVAAYGYYFIFEV